MIGGLRLLRRRSGALPRAETSAIRISQQVFADCLYVTCSKRLSPYTPTCDNGPEPDTAGPFGAPGVGASAQKLYCSVSCTMRGSEVSRILPKFGLAMSPMGSRNWAWLNRLKNSARNSMP